MPSSKKCVPGSISRATRSRAVRRFFLCCDSMAFAPPPCRRASSSFLMVVRRSTMWRVFFWNSGDSGLTLVFRTEANPQGPRTRESQLIEYTKDRLNVRIAQAKIRAAASQSLVRRRQALVDELHDVLRGGSRKKNLGDARLFQRRDVRFRNNPAEQHGDVIHALLMQKPHQLRAERSVCAGKNGE